VENKAQVAFFCSLATISIEYLPIGSCEGNGQAFGLSKPGSAGRKKEIEKWRVDEHDIYDKCKTHEKDW